MQRRKPRAVVQASLILSPLESPSVHEAVVVSFPAASHVLDSR